MLLLSGTIAAYLAVQHSPTIKLDDAARAPHVVELAVTRVMTVHEVDRFCGHEGIKLIPLAQLDVDRRVSWYLTTATPQVELYVIQGDACYEKLERVDLPIGEHIGLWARIPANARPPAKIALQIHGPIQAKVAELELGDDLTSAFTKALDVPPGDLVEAPITIKSAVRRDISVYAFAHAKQLGFGHRDQPQLLSRYDVTVRPDTPAEFSLYSDGDAKVTLVVTDHKTVVTEHDIYIKPDPGAGVAERALADYSIHRTAYTTLTQETADYAARLFTTIDRVFFVYGIAERETCELHVGEPVILIDAQHIMHANGLGAFCDFRDDNRITDFLSVKRPAKLVWPKVADPASDQHQQDMWSEEGFLSRAGSDKQIASYKKAKDSASKCYDREWDRLDPDHKANQYDLVTYRGGEIAKVESYGNKIYRQVAAACHVDAVSKQRDAIYARLLKSFKADEKKRLDAIATRFATE